MAIGFCFPFSFGLQRCPTKWPGEKDKSAATWTIRCGRSGRTVDWRWTKANDATAVGTPQEVAEDSFSYRSVSDCSVYSSVAATVWPAAPRTGTSVSRRSGLGADGRPAAERIAENRRQVTLARGTSAERGVSAVVDRATVAVETFTSIVRSNRRRWQSRTKRLLKKGPTDQTSELRSRR